MIVVNPSDDERKLLHEPEWISISWPNGEVYSGLGWAYPVDMNEAWEPVIDIAWDTYPPVLACWVINCIGASE